MDFDTILQDYIEAIDNRLERHLLISYPEIIYKSASYSLFSGGKRVRPVILLAVCEMLGGWRKNALPFACALEMIHTYSMIHDDLPSLDNDDMRRGKPTNHMVYGEAMALLAGDALLNRAYEIMARFCVANNDTHFVKAMAKIAEYAGIEGMIGGQVMDIVLEGKIAVPAEIEFVYTNKTAKLFMAAFGCGALAAGKDDETVSAMEQIGKKLGIAFQIKDDLLDISGDANFGKPIGSDAKNKKCTYVSTFGVDGATQKYQELSAAAINELKELNNSEFLVTLAEKLVDRSR